MPHRDPTDIDLKSPPFDQLKTVRPLETNRTGRDASVHARHQLYVGRDRDTAAQMLVKLTTRPGLVYEHNITNEIEILTTVNRELPASSTFPVIKGHGRMRDGRVYLMTYLFDELALASSIDAERIPSKNVSHLRTTIEVARALMELHRIPIFHVDLNPMNILHRLEQGRPVIRIVDFESSYRPCTPFGGLLRSAHDPGLLRARGIAPAARCQGRRVLAGRRAVHDAHRLWMDLEWRRAGKRAGRPGTRSGVADNPVICGRSGPESAIRVSAGVS